MRRFIDGGRRMTSTPSDALGPGATEVLLVVVGMHRPTVRAVAEHLGRSPSTVHKHLRRLKDEGLVDWESNRDGTLRPLVAPVYWSNTRSIEGGTLGVNAELAAVTLKATATSPSPPGTYTGGPHDG